MGEVVVGKGLNQWQPKYHHNVVATLSFASSPSSVPIWVLRVFRNALRWWITLMTIWLDWCWRSYCWNRGWIHHDHYGLITPFPWLLLLHPSSWSPQGLPGHSKDEQAWGLSNLIDVGEVAVVGWLHLSVWFGTWWSFLIPDCIGWTNGIMTWYKTEYHHQSSFCDLAPISITVLYQAVCKNLMERGCLLLLYCGGYMWLCLGTSNLSKHSNPSTTGLPWYSWFLAAGMAPVGMMWHL